MRSNVLMGLLAGLAILVLGACSTPISVPLTEAGALGAFKPIKASRGDTCETQQQVAEHNSRYDTLKQGRDVTYKAACALDPKTAAKPTPAQPAAAPPPAPAAVAAVKTS